MHQFFRVLCPAVVLACAAAAHAFTINALGDSYTDEYSNYGRRNQHRSWVELLSNNFSRSAVDFGTSKTVTNYPFNFAYSGATSFDARYIQTPKLFQRYASATPLGYADYVVIDVGINDFHGLTSASPSVPQTYIDIGRGNSAVTAATTADHLSNVAAMVSAIRAVDPAKKIILANVGDWGATHPFRTASIDKSFNIDFRGTGGSQNAALRGNVSAVVDAYNDVLESYAASQGIVVVDKNRLMDLALTGGVPLTSKNTISTSYNPSVKNKQGGAYDFWADGLHYSTVMQGLYANILIAAFNYYGESLTYLTPQQIINGFKGSTTAPTGGFSSLWNFNDFLLTPGSYGALSMHAIPEPGAALLLSAALTAALLRRRPRRPAALQAPVP